MFFLYSRASVRATRNMHVEDANRRKQSKKKNILMHSKDHAKMQSFPNIGENTDTSKVIILKDLTSNKHTKAGYNGVPSI